MPWLISYSGIWHNLHSRWMTATEQSCSPITVRMPRPTHPNRPGFSTPLLLTCLILSLSLQLRASDTATITFSLDFPASNPEHYKISVQSDGHGTYESAGKVSTDADDAQKYSTEFTLSEPTRARIFELAAQAHYFSGKIDSGNKKLAFTGSKRLDYQDAKRTTSAEFNYSSVPAVQQLTTLFQSMAATLEFGHRLTYDHRHQKLALDDELTHMEDQAHRGELSELQAIRPILQQIYDDSTVINVVRAKALRLMEQGSANVSR